MGHMGALAHVLLGQCKTAVIMVGAYLWFDSHYASLQLMGATGAVLAIVAYMHVTIQEQSVAVAAAVVEDEKELSLPLVANEKG